MIPRCPTRVLLLAAVGVGACTPADDGPSRPDGMDTADTDTGPATAPFACDSTDNALRFACRAHLDGPEAVRLTYQRADGTGAARVVTSPTAVDHELTMVMLAPDTAYDWVLATEAAPDTPLASGTVHTDPAPSGLPAAIAVEGTSSVPYVGTHSPCNPLAIAVIFDTATGELVWYENLDAGGGFGFQDMVQFTEDHTVLGETGGRVVEVDLAGRRLLELERHVDYDGNLHHDLYKADGLVYTLFNDGWDNQPLLDGYHAFDAATGALVATWRSEDLPLPIGVTGDWTHFNTIRVEDDGDVLISSYTQHSVILIGGPTSPAPGQVAWALAGSTPAGFGSDFAADWSAIDGPATFEHPHDAKRTPASQLVFLDNAHGRGLVADLDEEARTARFVEAYPVTAAGAECGPQGTASFSSAGHYFFACSGPDLEEFAPGAVEPVWRGAVESCGPLATVARWYPLEGW